MERMDTDHLPVEQVQMLRAEQESAKANAAVRARQLADRIQEDQKERQRELLHAQTLKSWHAGAEGPLRTALPFQGGAAAAEQTLQTLRPAARGGSPAAPVSTVPKTAGTAGDVPWARCRVIGLVMLLAGAWTCLGTIIMGLAALLPVLSGPSAYVFGMNPLSTMLLPFAPALTFAGTHLLLQLPAEHRTRTVNTLLPYAQSASLIMSGLYFLAILLAFFSAGHVIRSLLYTAFFVWLNILVFKLLDRLLEKYLLHPSKK